MTVVERALRPTARRRNVLIWWVVAWLVAGLAPEAVAVPRGRDAIGDSVMLGAREELRARGVRVDATVSRQFRDAVPIVRSMAVHGALRRLVVIHLGTNGILIDGADCDAISKTAGKARRVVLVTVTGPTSSVRKAQNTRLRACASRHVNTRVVDWYGHSRGHGSWFYADGLHLTVAGQRAYAAFVDERTS
jgi:hypothetical protein